MERPVELLLGLRQLLVAVITTFSLFGASVVHADIVFVTVVDNDGKPLPNAVISIPGEPKRPLKNAIMDQVNSQFLPHVLAIPVGSEVLFPNSDNIRHHVYSFSPAKTFETKLYANEARPRLEFGTAGIVALGCNIHDQMRGYIYVSPHQVSVVTDANGQAQLELKQDTEVLLWHPWLEAQTGNNAVPTEMKATISVATRTPQVQLAVTAPAEPKSEPSKLRQRFQRRSTDGT